MMKKSHPITAALFTLSTILLLSACVSVNETIPQTKPTDMTLAIAPVKSKEPQEPVEFEIKAFPEDLLYQLLVADIALIRGQFELALEKYLYQARETRDLSIIEMANRIAHHQGETDAVLETALLWLEAASYQSTTHESTAHQSTAHQGAAHQAALQAYALRNDPLKALPHAHWLFVNQDDIEAFLAVTAINEGAKQQLIQPLIEAYQNLSLDRKKQPAVLLAQAILYRENTQFESAVESAKNFLAIDPDNQRGLLFLAQILHQQNKITEASSLIEDALQRLPNNKSLRLQYARFLTLTDRPQAIVQFEMLRLQDADDQQINFLLALLYLNQGSIQAAIDLFNKASTDPYIKADAHYHLGSIADRAGDIVNALQHYQRVRSGRNYLAATSRTALLLAQQQGINTARIYLQRLRSEQPSQSSSLFQIESNLLVSTNQPDQAIDVLTNGLRAHPDDAQLLYARSMVAELQDNFQLAEQDLRAVLAQDADNSAALNALGYTMLLHTDRREEAHTLIKRAYLLNPGDPAIMDSLGWVLFMLGDAQQALPHLEKAMAIMADPEIAAHLGEVQWFLGDKQAALQTWRQGLRKAPNHKTIKETMERLGADVFSIEYIPDPIEEPRAE